MGNMFLPSGYLRCLSHLLLFSLLSGFYFVWDDPSLSSYLIPRTTSVCRIISRSAAGSKHSPMCLCSTQSSHIQPSLYLSDVYGSCIHTWGHKAVSGPSEQQSPNILATGVGFIELIFSSGAAVERLVLGWFQHITFTRHLICNRMRLLTGGTGLQTEGWRTLLWSTLTHPKNRKIVFTFYWVETDCTL